MKQIDDLFTAIAREHLGIETLQPRNSDALDFHTVSVWSVEVALRAAYEAGAAASDPVRYARTWARTAREVLAQPGRTDDVDCLLNLALSQIDAALALAGAADLPPADDHARQPYSVLLLYPDEANDDGTETYYAFVEATDPIAAIAEARRKALATNEWTEDGVDPDGFTPLLVIAGHHYGQPMAHD